MKSNLSDPNYISGWNDEEINVAFKSYINTVNREIGRRFRPAIIICPGGAYEFRSDTEREYVAIKFQSCGYQSFVLDYSVKVPFPKALFELASLIKHIRENADYYDVDPSKIFVCGFSAGGHLAAQMGALWNSNLFTADAGDNTIIKPDGIILCYPVITSGQYSHKDTIDNLTVGMKDEYQKYISVEECITGSMPPVFVWHTLNDPEVPVENTMLLIEKLRANNISFECHVFSNGLHGLSLGTDYTAVSEDHINKRVSKWFDLADMWIRSFYERK